ncbi:MULTISPECIES: YdcF family protein [unclassified Gordonia (in: high G+C Gram-positive bacteria)]
MRLRKLAITLAATVVTTVGVTAGGVVAAPAEAHADTGSSSSDLAYDLFSPTSIFLWQSPPTRYIVVLGAKVGLLGQAPEILQQRMNLGARLARTHPFNRVIVSGGDTWWLPVSEAQFMNIGLLQRGVPVWQMVNESASLSTVQNAEFTVRMLKAMGASGAVIVTNGFHMSRALKNFRDASNRQHANLQFSPAYA